MTPALRRHPTNPRYVTDQSGRAILLTGAHYWPNVIDAGDADPPPAFDWKSHFREYLNYGHTFIRFWAWETAWLSGDSPSTAWRYFPNPYQRTGPGTALDGKPKFDLTKFDDRYFARFRERAQWLHDRGVIVSVMILGGGWAVGLKGQPSNQNSWQGHPYNASNNINGVNGDTGGDGFGHDIFDTTNPSYPYQIALMKYLVDWLNDLPNLIWEICNECSASTATGGLAWQEAMATEIRNYEQTKPSQHLVWISQQFPNPLTEAQLYGSNADIVSPNNLQNNYHDDPPLNDGTKIVVVDTDHTCGLCLPMQWPLKAFFRGHNLQYMDYYSTYYTIDPPPSFSHTDPNLVTLRRLLGWVGHLSRQIDLASCAPSTTLTNTAYCLAGNTDILIYNPTGVSPVSVDLTTYPGTWAVQWLRSDTMEHTDGGTVAGGANRDLSPPSSAWNLTWLRKDRAPGAAVSQEVLRSHGFGRNR